MNTAITCHMIATVGAVKIPVALSWNHKDPHAVVMNAYAEAPTEWWFALDLLWEGVRAEAGIGDIRVRPATEYGRTEIELSSPDGNAVLTFNTWEIESFLAGTWCAEQPIPDFVPFDLDEEATS